MRDAAENNQVLTFHKAAIIALFIILVRSAVLIFIKDRETLLLIDDLLFTMTCGLAAVCMIYAAKHTEGRSKSAWMILAVAQMASIFGEATWAFIEVGLHQNPFPSLADVGFLMFYPLFAIGIFLLPKVPLSSSERLKFLLDAGIIMIAATSLFWIFLISPAIASNELETLELVVSVAYPIMDLILFFALMELLFRKLDSLEQTSLVLLALSMAISIATDAIFTIQTNQETYVSGSLLDTGWLVSYLLLGLAGILQASSPIPDRSALRDDVHKRRALWTYYLPYLGIGMASIFLIWGYYSMHSISFPSLAGSIWAIVGLMFIRQKITLDEDSRLLATTLAEIERRKRIEENLRRSEEQYRRFFETSRDCVFITSPQGKWIDFNDAVSELFGYNREEALNIHIADLYEDKEERRTHLQFINEHGFSKDYPVNLKKKDGTIINALVTSVVVKGEGNSIVCYQGVIRDVTEHKRTENMLKESLAEKEQLLKEIHHRVKNNLQIISTILYLQSLSLTDENLIKVFDDSQNRIKSIALIHENLYRSGNLGKVDFNEYIRQLISHLSKSYGDLWETLTLKVNLNNALLNIDTAIPCGMIINELVSNSLKHAFPKGMTGEIYIDFSPEDDGFKLVVGDNGVGISEDLDIKNSDTLGLQLVDALVKQIDGRIRAYTTNGTRYEIHFKESEGRVK